VRRLTLPYAAKLLIQELASMNIRTSFKLVEQMPR
jgi:DNA-directed RNA polymerase beta subunit